MEFAHLSLTLRSAKSFTSRKIVFLVVWPKFSKFTRNACSIDNGRRRSNRFG